MTQSRALTLIGLCNEGLAGTRHSVGGALVEFLCESWGIIGGLALHKPSRCDLAQLTLEHGATLQPAVAASVLLARPRGFMNLSGRPVSGLLRARDAPISDIIIAHDDLDLPLGRWQWRTGGSARGHNGVKSVCDALKTQDFHRLRIGIGRPVDKAQVPDYVLQRFTKEERATLLGTVFPSIRTEFEQRAREFQSAIATSSAVGGPSSFDALSASMASNSTATSPPPASVLHGPPAPKAGELRKRHPANNNADDGAAEPPMQRRRTLSGDGEPT